MTREEIRELCMRVEMKDLEIENAEDDNETELRVYKQKTNFIKYCHDNKLKEASNACEMKLENASNRHVERVEDMEDTKMGMRNELTRTEEQNTSEISNLQQDTEMDLTNMKEKLDADVKLFEQRCDEQHIELQKKMASRREAELKIVDSRKESHLCDLAKSHEHRCNEMQTYFAGVERQQEIGIEDLEAEIRRLKKAAMQHESKSNQLKESNDTCGEELQTCSEKVVTLEHSTKDLEKDSISLRNTNARLSAAQKAIVEARAQYKQLQEKFNAVELERDSLTASNIHDASANVIEEDLKRQNVLKKVLEQTKDTNIVIEQHLQHIASSAGLQPEKAEALLHNMQEFLDQYNVDLEKLNLNIAQATDSYKNQLHSCRSELLKRGVSREKVDSINGLD